ncbi:hypothetical protein [Nitrosomonas communis]|uniref:hypothetical protein n=1 Tax=Nitrosomonas communis TaxID=44574 RepID=UPI003D293CF6
MKPVEKIDVPTFDGHECIGMRVPMYEDDCYVLNSDGSSLIHRNSLTTDCKMWIQVCYRKINPRRIVLEFTGEIRRAKPGEWFSEGDSKAYVRARSEETIQEFQIWRVVEERS